jgi:hypothetical protein
MRGFDLIVKFSKQSFARNLLILAALPGTVLLGWLTGHILRYSIPALWHPPVQETNPHIENGYEFENERFIFTPQESPWVRVHVGDMQLNPPERCVGLTYYTSLPAKCHTADGQLVRVGGAETGAYVIPADR